MLPKRRDQLEQQSLARLCAVKQFAAHPASPLGPDMVSFFKQSVQKRQTKLGKIAECWGLLIPEMIGEHCSLESFTRGHLTVLVDSPSHLYELKQLLLAGLQDQLLLACKRAGLRKITLRAGKWYAGEDIGLRGLPRFK
jgi:hypothetical protein